MATVNNIPKPPDILIAQFSIPFCVALALYRNAIDPYSFDEASTRDAAIMSMASKVKMTFVPGQADDDISSTVTLALKDQGNARKVCAADAEIPLQTNGSHLRSAAKSPIGSQSGVAASMNSRLLGC